MLRVAAEHSRPPRGDATGQVPAGITAGPASLAAQLEGLQAAAASLAPSGGPAAGVGSSAAAGLADIQRQLRELQQLAQQVQQPKLHAAPHTPLEPEHQLAAAAQLPSSPACSQLPGGGYDIRPPAAYLNGAQPGWAPPPAGLRSPAGFQSAGGPWPEPAAPVGPPRPNGGNDACLVRLPGNPTLSSARSILAATLRRAVPCYERSFEAKRAALNGLLRLGMARIRGSDTETFEQAPVAIADLADELQQVRAWPHGMIRCGLCNQSPWVTLGNTTSVLRCGDMEVA